MLYGLFRGQEHEEERFVRIIQDSDEEKGRLTRTKEKVTVQ